MDIQMPVMDGLEASSRIVEHSASRPIIIATTANLAEVDKRKCFAVGMNDFITKPLSQDDLKLAILKWQGLKEYLDDDANGSSIKMSS
jgi:CheY-like chemotaxis protein